MTAMLFRSFKFILICISIAALSACVVKTDNPISEVDSGVYDASLHGTWYWKDSSETGYLHIGVESEGQYKIFMVETNKMGKVELEEYIAHISTVGSNKYLNVLINHKEGNKGYIFVKYEILKDGLKLFIPDMSVLEDGVESGKLKGTYSKNKKSVLRITESSERIAKFIIENDKDLFPEGKVLPRLDLEK